MSSPTVMACGRLSAALAQSEGKLGGSQLGRVATLLEEAEDDVLAFYAFPDDASRIRRTTMLAIEQDDEWPVGRRYTSAASMGSVLEHQAA